MTKGAATALVIHSSENPGSAPDWFALRDAAFVDSLRDRAKQSGARTWREGRTKSPSGSRYCMLDIAHFLERVYRLSNSDEDGAIDAVYEFMDDCLLEGEFSVCNIALESANPKKLPHSVIVSFLMVTQRAKGKMDNGRKEFYERAIEAVSETHDQAYVQKLLRNYR